MKKVKIVITCVFACMAVMAAPRKCERCCGSGTVFATCQRCSGKGHMVVGSVSRSTTTFKCARVGRCNVVYGDTHTTTKNVSRNCPDCKGINRGRVKVCCPQCNGTGNRISNTSTKPPRHGFRGVMR